MRDPRQATDRGGRAAVRGSRRRGAWCASLLLASTAYFAGMGCIETVDAAPRKLTLTMRGGLLSGEITGVPLREVLERLTSVTGIPIGWRGGGDPESGPHRFVDLPPTDAIRRILAKQDFLLASGPMDDGAWRLQLWITSSDGTGSAARRIDGRLVAANRIDPAGWATLLAAVPASVAPLAQAAAVSAEAEDRLASVRALEQAAAEDSRVALLIRGIAERDADAGVRQAANEVLGTAAPN